MKDRITYAGVDTFMVINSILASIVIMNMSMMLDMVILASQTPRRNGGVVHVRVHDYLLVKATTTLLRSSCDGKADVHEHALCGHTDTIKYVISRRLDYYQEH